MIRTPALIPGLALWAIALAQATAPAAAQSRLQTMPGYDTYAAMEPRISSAVKLGAVQPNWSDDSRSFSYMLNGRLLRFDLRTRTSKEIDAPAPPQQRGAAGGPQGSLADGLVLARGRGADADVISPDGKLRAFSRDLNVWLRPAAGGAETQVSTDGSVAARIRNGVGSYIYLEEFAVRSPVWWSPDSSKIAWQRYDESKVEDYFLPLEQTKQQSKMLTEAYPHPGKPNPMADLLVYDVKAKTTVTMDVREGQPFSDDVVGHYAWDASWTQDGSEILVKRADRRQKVFDLAACSPVSGACRSVVRETRPKAWASGASPVFLKDGQRFIWTSERTDYRNFYLYDLSGRLIATLTNHPFDVGEVLKIDERNGFIWYTARSGDNYLKMQLHRVNLDGTGDVRLTDPAFNHRVSVAPDGKNFVDVAQTHDIAPTSSLMNGDGKKLATIAESDESDAKELGLKHAELVSFTSADSRTPLLGLLQFPSNFDPSRKYPLLVSVYGGPNTSGASENFQPASPLTEYGFLLLRLDARTASGRGRKILDSVYQRLGVAEMDDIAAGIRTVTDRPYVDGNRVGIFGTSYGGTTAATVMLRHPDIVQAAVSNSPVTDWRLYDSAYSERFLGLPDTDAAAYDRAAVLNFAEKLRGELMIYFGTSDDNVHPKNSLQLIQALQKSGRSFEVQVGPDKGHTSVDQKRMMEFFIQKLVIDRGG
jgi:dipeptidyl-peptidase-4